MRLWTTKAVCEKEPELAYLGIRCWRSSLHLSVSQWWVGLSWTENVKFVNCEWKPIGSSGWDVFLRRRWQWQTDHYWYDGPHCEYGWGFLFIRVHNTMCKECCPP